VVKLLRTLLGSSGREQILAHLVEYGEGYASEIARASGLDLFAVQNQLGKFEAAGILESRRFGRLRLYCFHPRFPLLQELQALIEKAHEFQSARRQRETEQSLPNWLRPYFWDYSFRNLSWPKDRDLVIRRLLAAGSWNAITWLRKRLGDDALRKWLISHRGRGLSPRQVRFWTLILGVPKLQAEAWARSARSTPWAKR